MKVSFSHYKQSPVSKFQDFSSRLQPQAWQMVTGLAQLIFEALQYVSKPFCFLSARNERARNKSKIQSPSIAEHRRAQAPRPRENKWGQPVARISHDREKFARGADIRRGEGATFMPDLSLNLLERSASRGRDRQGRRFLVAFCERELGNRSDRRARFFSLFCNGLLGAIR